MKRKIRVGVNNNTLYVNDVNVNLLTKTLLDFL
jgi:hypothetical protein